MRLVRRGIYLEGLENQYVCETCYQLLKHKDNYIINLLPQFGEGTKHRIIDFNGKIKSTRQVPVLAFLFLAQAKFIPTSRPSQMLCPLPGTFFPQLVVWLCLPLFKGEPFWRELPWFLSLKEHLCLYSKSHLKKKNSFCFLLITQHFLRPCCVPGIFLSIS